MWEFPTVYISQKLRVAKYLGEIPVLIIALEANATLAIGTNVVIWGGILMLHAAASSFQAFFALRFLLGMCECCVAPILILIIGMFYKKHEQVSNFAAVITDSTVK